MDITEEERVERKRCRWTAYALQNHLIPVDQDEPESSTVVALCGLIGIPVDAPVRDGSLPKCAWCAYAELDGTVETEG
ncbi:hypothetical protein [Saccharopolyspora spinosa]|uniref:DUF3039 family protein n=1 Tax=Saccharopolyspora spinosa TaxID=60894 RepID=A0A2N3XUF4_SACSN|nr:hypothetical protein [Saccharopolyspora spinosa]PKW14282.1 hypothetical protein A8926_1887 [Saccharopolyspora spinosa]